jgi:tetratricopeptide (TPR) repeat protein
LAGGINGLDFVDSTIPPDLRTVTSLDSVGSPTSLSTEEASRSPSSPPVLLYGDFLIDGDVPEGHLRRKTLDTTKLLQGILQPDGEPNVDDFHVAAELRKKTGPGRLRSLPRTTLDELYSLRRAALAHLKADQLEDAEPEFQALLKLTRANLGHVHSLIEVALGSLAFIYQHLENFNKAERYYQQMVQYYKNSSQQHTPPALFALRGLAHVHVQQALEPKKATWADGISEQEQAVTVSIELYGPAHDVTEECLWDLLQYLKSGRQLDAAELRYRELWSKYGHGQEHEEHALWNLRYLAYIHILQGRTHEALLEISELCKQCQKSCGPTNLLTLLYRHHQAVLLKRLRMYEQSLVVNMAVVSAYETLKGPYDKATLRAVANLATCHAARGSDDAAGLFRRALAGYELLGDMNQITRCRLSLGVLLKRKDFGQEGDALIARASSEMSSMTCVGVFGLLDVVFLLIKCYLDRREIDTAVQRYRGTEGLLRWALKRSWLPSAPILDFMRQSADAFSLVGRHDVSERLYTWLTWEDELRKLESDPGYAVFGQGYAFDGQGVVAGGRGESSRNG